MIFNLVCIYDYSYFLGHLMQSVSGNLVRWRSGRPHVTSYMTLLTRPLAFTMNKHVGTSQWVTSCYPNSGNVLGYLQDGLNDIESESECSWKRPQHGICWGRVTKSRSLPTGFPFKQIFILPLCVILQHYNNLTLCPNFLMKENRINTSS
jgi:hypothetical protein